jgi:hypothetical protein
MIIHGRRRVCVYAISTRNRGERRLNSRPGLEMIWEKKKKRSRVEGLLWGAAIFEINQ